MSSLNSSLQVQAKNVRWPTITSNHRGFISTFTIIAIQRLCPATMGGY